MGSISGHDGNGTSGQLPADQARSSAKRWSSPFLDTARNLAKLGYYTFPCREAGKEPLCPHGCREATRDERQHLHWADKWPYANVGVALGPSDVLGLDIDARGVSI